MQRVVEQAPVVRGSLIARLTFLTVLLVGWLIPLAVAATYVFVLMPASARLGVGEAYEQMGGERQWLALWGAGWILGTAVVATICAFLTMTQGANLGATSRVKLILWPLATVELGSFIVAAPMSTALSHVGYDGPIHGAWLGSGGVLLGLVALVGAFVLTVRDVILEDR
ncbi:hypothetical protein ACFCVO_03415 [Agromyces sp. NPDC056379]|uniref:hypothetical protein n=1 Tax=unclassified Agromyces TaxID=2639701 RepID=UPI0035DE1408